MMNIKRAIKDTLYNIDLYVWEMYNRVWWTNEIAETRLKNLGLASLSREQKIAIANRYGKKYSTSKWYNIYAHFLKKGEQIEEYLPDHFYMKYIEPFFNKPLIARKNEDKNLYDMFFHGIRMPKTIVRQIDGLLMDDQWKIIDENDVVSRCSHAQNVIIKTASESGGGHGIVFWNKEDDPQSLLRKIKMSENVIVQQIITQHPQLAALHPSSINTLRITTIIFNGEVIVSSHFVRMGVEGKKVDNVSSGGMLCNVNSDGTLSNVGYDEYGRSYTEHPTSHTKFADVVIPNFDECLQLCVDAAPRLSHIAKLISWDVAVEEDGHPTLIEANLTYCDIGIYQIACGPVLGNRDQRKRIIDAVREKNKV